MANGRDVPRPPDHSRQYFIPDHILWVGDDSGLDADEGSQPTSMLELLDGSNSPDCFKDDTANRLQACIGDKFVRCQPEWNFKQIHESIVIASEVSRLSGCRLTHMTWDALVSTFESSLASASHIFEDKTLVLFCFTSKPPLEIVERVYSRLARDLRVLAGKQVRCYPSFEEYWTASVKLGDIQALDDIAGRSTESHSYRPTTCRSMAACSLLQTPSVLKRTNSACSNHVITKPTPEDLELLDCDLGKMSKEDCVTVSHPPLKRSRTAKSARTLSKAQRSQRQPIANLIHAARQCSWDRWFHQQLEPALLDGGEFRVVIVTNQDLDGTKSRRVLDTFLTRNVGDRLTVEVINSRTASLTQPLPFEFAKNQTLAQLEDFALEIFDELRRLQLSGYQSLDVGVRLDIGISKERNGGRFFVNEITRIYAADLFSNSTASPKTGLCMAVAHAMVDQLFHTPTSPIRAEAEQDEVSPVKRTPSPIPSASDAVPGSSLATAIVLSPVIKPETIPGQTDSQFMDPDSHNSAEVEPVDTLTPPPHHDAAIDAAINAGEAEIMRREGITLAEWRSLSESKKHDAQINAIKAEILRVEGITLDEWRSFPWSKKTQTWNASKVRELPRGDEPALTCAWMSLCVEEHRVEEGA